MTRLSFAVLLLILSLPIASCDTSDPADPGPTTPVATVFILEDQGTEEMVAQVLRDAGHTVTMGGPYQNFSAQNVSAYDLVILLNGVHWTSQVPQAGQDRLRDYVGAGGTLLVTEWISWSGSTNETINAILPATYGGSWSTGSETYTRVATHPITAGLPATFTVPPDWSYSVTTRDPTPAKQAQTLITGSASGSAVTVGRFGDGTIVQWNMGGHYNGEDIWTDDTRRLLTNIAAFAESLADAD